ncbi:J domain-containing protein [Geoalkalibacter sp.]|uniref:J domain-containing protein n=1 Tax=Geoalkalibacter sp. TaxID=3041440 RepID=UPI00272E7BE7|nr:J domain-containing protein [Geoalkalibacter sp.]
MPAAIQETEILKACRTLFGAEVWLDRHFLFYLQHDGAKAAFRKRAKETHPDRFPGEPQIQRRQSEQFQAVARAYDLVNSFLNTRDRGLWPPRAKPAATRQASPGADRRPPGPKSSAPLLQRTYPLGLFLYTQGLIPYRTLIEALVWQRRQRPSIGETAQRWGWLNEAAVRTILSQRGHHRFGEKAVDLGLLTPFQVRTLLFYQRSRHQRLGQFFVDKGLITPTELEELVRQMQEHNTRVRTQRGGAQNG